MNAQRQLTRKSDTFPQITMKFIENLHNFWNDLNPTSYFISVEWQMNYVDDTCQNWPIIL